MHIIQITGGGLDANGNEMPLYGLDADGSLYIFQHAYRPYLGLSAHSSTPVWQDGRTEGWELLAYPGQLSSRIKGES